VNPVKSEPVTAATVATLVSWLAAKFAVGLDATDATAIALVVLAVANWLARALSIPLSRHQKVVNEVIQAANAPKA
jgi:hypothetical protein